MAHSKFFLSSLLAFGLIANAGAASAASLGDELVVYTYDTLVADGGWLKKVIPLFEKKCACRVRALGVGDAGQLLARLQLEAERGKTQAHIVVGIDQNLWERSKKLAYDWKSWRPEGWKKLSHEVHEVLGKDPAGFLPFDFGVYAWIADSEQLGAQKPPTSWAELLDAPWKRKLILEDPRTSTPGLAFVLAIASMHPGSDFSQTIGQMKNQWLTLAPSWDAAYGLFLKKEAPLVWSYVTSEAYHREHGDTKGRYRAVVLKEGMPAQLEGAFAVAAGLTSPALEKRTKNFLEFLLSEDAQREIPKTNWMLPARMGVPLPASFSSLPHAEKILSTERSDVAIKAWLEKWRTAL